MPIRLGARFSEQGALATCQRVASAPCSVIAPKLVGAHQAQHNQSRELFQWRWQLAGTGVAGDDLGRW